MSANTDLLKSTAVCATCSRMSSLDHRLSMALEPGSQRRNRMPADAFIKAATCRFLARLHHQDHDSAADALYGPIERNPALRRAIDRPEIIFKAASGPASTGQAGWAAEISGQQNYGGPLAQLAPTSLNAQLSQRGQRGVLAGNASVRFPNRAATPSMGGAFVGENAPIRVAKGALGSVVLSGFKLAVISVFSNELAKRSTPDVEQVLRQGLRRGHINRARRRDDRRQRGDGPQTGWPARWRDADHRDGCRRACRIGGRSWCAGERHHKPDRPDLPDASRRESARAGAVARPDRRDHPASTAADKADCCARRRRPLHHRKRYARFSRDRPRHGT